MRSHFEAIGRGSSRGNRYRGGRCRAPFEGERIDFEVLLQGRHHIASGRIDRKNDIRPLTGRCCGGGCVTLVERPVVGIGIPGRIGSAARDTAPVKRTRHEGAGGDLNEVIRDIPGEAGETAGSRALNHIRRTEAGDPAIDKIKQGVGGEGA